MKTLNSNIEKLRTITALEWDLLHSLRLQASHKRYRDKILNYCQGSNGILKRIDQLLVIAEQSSSKEGLIIGTDLNLQNVDGVEVVSLIGLDFKLAFEVIDEIEDKFLKQSISTSSGAIGFKNIFKTDELHKQVIDELSKENPTKWFDENGNWNYQGKRNAQQSAACELLTLLVDFNYIKPEHDTLLRKKDTKVAYVKDLFGVTVGSRSRTIMQREDTYRALASRIKKVKQ